MKLYVSLLLLTLASIVHGFTPVTSRQPTVHNTHHMVPKYNPQEAKWEPQGEEDTAAAGYPAINTLLRHGPKAFFTRVFTPDDYEQAVLKFMAGDKCDRKEAQGNMDFYLENPNDWAYERFEQQKKGIKYDYVTIKPKALVLVLGWSSLVLGGIGRAIYSLNTGESFVSSVFYGLFLILTQ